MPCEECFGKGLLAAEGHGHIFIDRVDMPHMLTMPGGTNQTVAFNDVTSGCGQLLCPVVDNHHMPVMPMTPAAVSPYVQGLKCLARSFKAVEQRTQWRCG